MNYIPNIFNDNYLSKRDNNPIVAVLDTGIDPNAKNLRFTPDGKRKIIDVVDCSNSDDIKVKELNFNNCDVYVLAELFNNVDRNNVKKYFYGERKLVSYFSERKLKLFDEKEINDINIKNHLFIIDDNIHADNKIIMIVEILQNNKSTYVYLEKYTENFHIGTIRITNKKINFVFQYRYDNDILIPSLVFDSGYHGTHVAGIIGAYDSNDHTKNGINPNVQMVSLKIGDSRFNGMETTKSLINALQYVIDNNIKIVNLSYGEPVNSNNGLFIKKLHEAIYKHNIIFVTSAGNSGPNITTTGAPACSTDRVISVGAYLNSNIQNNIYNQIGDYEGLYHWSSRGVSKLSTMGVDLVAIGCSVSTMPEWYSSDLKMLNGTSMSCPMVAGLVSIIRSYIYFDPHPYWMKQYLCNTCNKLKISPIEVGHGLVGMKFIDYKFLKKDYLIDFDTKGCFLIFDEEFSFKPVLKNLDESKSRNTKIVDLVIDDDSEIKIPNKINLSSDTMSIRFKISSDTSEYIYGYIDGYCIFSYPINKIIPEKIKIDEYIEYNDLFVSNQKMIRKYIYPQTNKLRINVKGKCYLKICQIYNDNYGKYDNRIKSYNIVSGDAAILVDIISNSLTEIVLYYPWNSYKSSNIDLKITSEMIIGNIISKDQNHILYDLINHEDSKPKETFKIKSIDYYLTANKTNIIKNKLFLEYDFDEYYDSNDNVYFINDICNEVYESDVESSGVIIGMDGHDEKIYCNYKMKKIDSKINKFVAIIESDNIEKLNLYKNMRILISRKVNYKKTYHMKLGLNKLDINIPKDIFKNIYEKKITLKCNMINDFDIEYNNTYKNEIRYYDSKKLVAQIKNNFSNINDNNIDDNNNDDNDRLKLILQNNFDDNIVKSLLNEREYNLIKYLETRNNDYIEKMKKLNYVNRKNDDVIFEDLFFELVENI
jgi:subtilisin family serine protease